MYAPTLIRRGPGLVTPPNWAAKVPDFWAVTENFDYALPDVRRIDREWAWELREAARDCAEIYAVAVKHLQENATDAELLALGIPTVAFQAVRKKRDQPTLVGRFDFIENQGLRVIEYNAETPFLVWESFGINGIACANQGYEDPNADAEKALIDALNAERGCSGIDDPVVAVVAINAYREDWFTGRWYEHAWRRAGLRARTVSAHDLHMFEGYLHDGYGRIDLLHHCYPLEHIAKDPAAADFFDAVEAGRIHIVNPPSALLAQNKAIMERIWTWGTNDTGIFTQRQREIIGRHFLATHRDRPTEGTWVRKPIFGREGNTVSIHRAGEIIDESEHAHYKEQAVVWQEHVEISPMRFKHAWGEEEMGWPIATCFTINGEPGPISMRLGDPITSAWAHFQPLGHALRRAGQRP